MRTSKLPFPLDVDFCRAQFPDACWQWAFFENAGGSYVPSSVIERLTDYMRETQVQPGAPFPQSAKAAERMDQGRRRMAEMINAAPDELVLGPSMSNSIYVLARALRPLWRDGDRVIVAAANHEANAGPWWRLAENGIDVVSWSVDARTGTLDPADLAPLLNDRTRLVAFPHASNLTGDINDVAGITGMAHDAGACVCVDAVAYAPHRAIDVKAWDVDFYGFSFYKIYGPHLGCLYGKRQRLLEARNQYHYFVGEQATSAKLNPAGPQHELIASLAGIADYFEAVAAHHVPEPANDLNGRFKQVFGLFADHEERLARRFVDYLRSERRIRLLGRDEWMQDARCPTFSFVVEGWNSADVCRAVEADEVAIRHGDFYARRLVEAVGLDPEDGVVRASMAHYTTEAEVDRLIAALSRALG